MSEFKNIFESVIYCGLRIPYILTDKLNKDHAHPSRDWCLLANEIVNEDYNARKEAERVANLFKRKIDFSEIKDERDILNNFEAEQLKRRL